MAPSLPSTTISITLLCTLLTLASKPCTTYHLTTQPALTTTTRRPYTSTTLSSTSRTKLIHKATNDEHRNPNKQADARIPLGSNRLLKITYKVKDVRRSQRFYESIFGLQCTTSSPGTCVLSYSTVDSSNKMSIELIEDSSFHGNIDTHDFLGLGIHLPSIEYLKSKYEEITKLGGTVKNEVDSRLVTPSIYPDENAKEEKRRVNAFVFDPDGYGIEVVEEAVGDPLHRIRYYTTSLKESSEFYETILSMQLMRHESHLREYSYPWDELAGMSKYFGYNLKDEQDGCLLQAVYAYDEDALRRGKGYQYLTIQTRDLELMESTIKQMMYSYKKIEGTSCEESIHIQDPCGLEIRLVGVQQ